MGITDRKLRQKEEVRASILDTAWEMVVTEGWHSFSIRKIADAIEYSVPVIYSHFENKDAILLEFNKKGFQLLAEALAAAKHLAPADLIRRYEATLTETMIAALPEPILAWMVNGTVLEARGNRDPLVAPQGCYPAAGDDPKVRLGFDGVPVDLRAQKCFFSIWIRNLCLRLRRIELLEPCEFRPPAFGYFCRQRRSEVAEK